MNISWPVQHILGQIVSSVRAAKSIIESTVMATTLKSLRFVVIMCHHSKTNPFNSDQKSENRGECV